VESIECPACGAVLEVNAPAIDAMREALPGVLAETLSKELDPGTALFCGACLELVFVVEDGSVEILAEVTKLELMASGGQAWDIVAFLMDQAENLKAARWN
jgi:hypothetical protein